MEKNLAKIKDPIQRAGVRLLWAAAIPIQTLARRFLARQYAIKRMCAVLTIQSVSNRWKLSYHILQRSSTSHIIFYIFSSYDDGMPSVTWKLLFGRRFRFKLHSGVGLLGTAWKTTIIVPPKSNVLLGGTSQLCTYLRTCTVSQLYRALFEGSLPSI